MYISVLEGLLPKLVTCWSVALFSTSTGLAETAPKSARALVKMETSIFEGKPRVMDSILLEKKRPLLEKDRTRSKWKHLARFIYPHLDIRSTIHESTRDSSPDKRLKVTMSFSQKAKA